MRKIFMGIALLGLASVSYASDSCDTQLHKYMDEMKTDMKTLSFEIKRGNFAEATQRIDNIIGLLEKSKLEKPYLFVEKELEGDELAARTADYQEVTDDTIRVFNALNKAIEQGDTDQLNGLMGEINDQRKRGHRAFKADC